MAMVTANRQSAGMAHPSDPRLCTHRSSVRTASRCSVAGGLACGRGDFGGSCGGGAPAAQPSAAPRAHAAGTLQAALRLGQQGQPGAGILLLHGAQGRKEAAAIGPTEPQPGLRPLHPRALPGRRSTGPLRARTRISPGPLPGLGPWHHRKTTDAEDQGQQGRSEPTLRAAAVEIARFACNGSVGRVQGDPLFDAVTEGRSKWKGYRSEERRVGKECRSRWSPYH